MISTCLPNAELTAISKVLKNKGLKERYRWWEKGDSLLTPVSVENVSKGQQNEMIRVTVAFYINAQ